VSEPATPTNPASPATTTSPNASSSSRDDPRSSTRFAHVASDRVIAAQLSRLLAVALLTTCVIIAIGLAWHGATTGLAQPRPDYAQFRPNGDAYRSLATTFLGVAAMDPRAVMQLGVILLIALPAARVLAMLIAMLRRRDVVYTLLCAAVLTVLLYGLLE
jgi:uncharacterized membrane protein